MCRENPRFDAPRQVRIEQKPTAVVYELADEFIAIHGCDRPTTTNAILFFDDEKIAVVRAGGDAAQRNGDVAQPTRDGSVTLGPVYSLKPGGSLAVPTGRVLVRFVEGTRVETRLSDLRTAGFDVEETLPYAPHTAWVRVAAGGISAALWRLPAVAEIHGVEHVEPEMLMKRSRRG